MDLVLARDCRGHDRMVVGFTTISDSPLKLLVRIPHMARCTQCNFMR